MVAVFRDRRIEPCVDSDVPALLDLFHKAYPFNPNLKSRDYFDWQFRNTPFAIDDQYAFFVLKEDNKIHAFVGALPVEFKMDGQLRRGCWPYQWYALGRGLAGMALISQVLDEFRNIFLIRMSDVSFSIFKGLGAVVQERMPRCVGIIDAKAMQEVFPNSLDSVWIEDSLRSLSCLEVSSGKVSYVDRFPDGWESFFDHWGGVQGYCRRTATFLNWRFKAIPRHNYRMLWDGRNGYAVYRVENIKDTPYAAIRIIEWNFVGQSAKDALALIVAEGRRSKAILIDFFVTLAKIRNELSAYGLEIDQNKVGQVPYLFRPIRMEPSFSIGMLMACPEEMEKVNLEAWYVTSGDSDFDRIKM